MEERIESSAKERAASEVESGRIIASLRAEAGSAVASSNEIAALKSSVQSLKGQVASMR